jgi:transposase-like protein
MRTNRIYPVDETYRDEIYTQVKGQNKYLYRAMDSTGQTIDFLQAARRDTAAAKRFFEKVFSSSSNPIPRVINVDKNSAEPSREYRNDEHDPERASPTGDKGRCCRGSKIHS